MSTLDFVRELLCLPPVRGPGCRTFPRLAVTGFAHHPYVRGGSGSPLQAAAPGSLPIHRLGPLVSMLNAAARRGRVPPRLPLHLTEFGFQSFPPDRFLGLPLGLQAAFLNASEWIAWRDPRVASLAQYLLRDDLGEGGFQTGLRFHDGRPKPALAAYRLALWVVPASRGVLVWGHDRVRVAAGSRVGVQHRTTARSRWRTLANIPGGTAFQRRFGLVAGEWRLMRTEVDHAPVASRIAVSGG
jgi:hypothetical protein